MTKQKLSQDKILSEIDDVLKNYNLYCEINIQYDFIKTLEDVCHPSGDLAELTLLHQNNAE